MKLAIHTEVTINASIQLVWDVLTDISEYPNWNPFIKSIEGQLVNDSKLRVELDFNYKRTMTFTPKVVTVTPGEHLAWLGAGGLNGRIFDGEHHFSLRQEASGSTVLEHYENFCGIFTRIFGHYMGDDTKTGFEAMNKALKARCEEKAAINRNASVKAKVESLVVSEV